MPTPSTYAIRFDFPDADAPIFAGMHKGAMGWAPTLATAQMFTDADEAQRWLDNGYGAARPFGRVVAIKAGYPVADAP